MFNICIILRLVAEHEIVSIKKPSGFWVMRLVISVYVNKIGPKMLPCGTPFLFVRHLIFFEFR